MLTTRQRGVLVRELAAGSHAGPDGRHITVARGTIDRWIRVYRAGGFNALAPVPRLGEPTTPVALRELAVALKREAPRRTAAQVAEIIRTTEGAGPRLDAAAALCPARAQHPARRVCPAVFGRFEAAQPGDLWTGDALTAR